MMARKHIQLAALGGRGKIYVNHLASKRHLKVINGNDFGMMCDLTTSTKVGAGNGEAVFRLQNKNAKSSFLRNKSSLITAFHVNAKTRKHCFSCTQAA